MPRAVTYHSGWLIRDFRLKLKLGWSAAERRRPQPVRFDVELRFPKPPRACRTDRLADTVCYDEATRRLVTALARREFRLLEHLAQEASRVLRQALPKGARLKLEVTKLKPPIRKLAGDVRFFLSDWEP